MNPIGTLMFVLGIGGTGAAFLVSLKSLEAGATIAIMITGIMALLAWGTR